MTRVTMGRVTRAWRVRYVHVNQQGGIVRTSVYTLPDGPELVEAWGAEQRKATHSVTGGMMSHLPPLLLRPFEGSRAQRREVSREYLNRLLREGGK